jgi:anti-sigma factor ChrR (cupin superfamily)
VTGCRGFEPLLEGWVAGTLESAARRAAAAHLAGCPDCRELCELARLTDGAADLTAQVLTATTGAACPRAEELLPAHLEASLAEPDRHLVARHLETCQGCSRLAQILTAVEAALPLLAERPVPASFTGEVLAALGAHGLQTASPQRPAVAPPGMRLSRWWRLAWPRVVERPRFATEIAYALTIAAILAVQATGSFAGTEPRELLDRARDETVAQVQVLAEAPAVSGTAETARRLGARWGDLDRALGRTAGTFVHRVASSLQTVDEPDSSAQTKETP